MIQIKHRWTGAVIREVDADTLTRADLTGTNLTGANLTRADLTGADLTRADLTGADLTRADLTGADLTRANLTGTDLTWADLTRADLTRADLTRADLTRANLTEANLTRADLTGADLTRANLTGTDLTEANLTRADLTGAHLENIQADLTQVLLLVPSEAEGLKQALIRGRVDGQVYYGDCACLVGTIANLKHCHYQAIPGLEPDLARPIERWFLAIRPGDTPDKSQVARITIEWIEKWQKQNPLQAPRVESVVTP